jgi:hypothetical protein
LIGAAAAADDRDETLVRILGGPAPLADRGVTPKRCQIGSSFFDRVTTYRRKALELRLKAEKLTDLQMYRPISIGLALPSLVVGSQAKVA